MNKDKRERLRAVLALFDQAVTTIDNVMEQEQDALDNMYDRFHGTERYEKMEDCVHDLETALDKLTEAREYIEATLT